jgi:hypothetical protein
MKLKPEEHRKAAASFGRSDKTPIGASIVLSLIAYEVMTEHERMPKPAPASAPEAISAAKPIEVQTLAIAEPAREPEKPVEPDPVMEVLSPHRGRAKSLSRAAEAAPDRI